MSRRCIRVRFGRHGNSCVLLHDADAHELIVAAVNGPAGNQMRGRRFPDADGVAGTVLKSKQPCVVTEVERSSRSFPVRSRSGRERNRPLPHGRPSPGRGSDARRRRGRQPARAAPFIPTTSRAFVNCCNVIAVAVENASLYRRLHDETEVFRRSRQDDAAPVDRGESGHASRHRSSGSRRGRTHRPFCSSEIRARARSSWPAASTTSRRGRRSRSWR